MIPTGFFVAVVAGWTIMLAGMIELARRQRELRVHMRSLSRDAFDMERRLRFLADQQLSQVDAMHKIRRQIEGRGPFR